jgi:hypothetical protein
MGGFTQNLKRSGLITTPGAGSSISFTPASLSAISICSGPKPVPLTVAMMRLCCSSHYRTALTLILAALARSA